jgi:nitrogen-specific signal transduction histidine kinase
VPFSSMSLSEIGAASAPNVMKAANRRTFATLGKGLANEAKNPLRRPCRS